MGFTSGMLDEQLHCLPFVARLRWTYL
jgi:hypothetical protein